MYCPPASDLSPCDVRLEAAPRRGSLWCNYRHVTGPRDQLNGSRDLLAVPRDPVSPFYSSPANLARQSLVEYNNSLIRISEVSVCVSRRELVGDHYSAAN